MPPILPPVNSLAILKTKPGRNLSAENFVKNSFPDNAKRQIPLNLPNQRFLTGTGYKACKYCCSCALTVTMTRIINLSSRTGAKATTCESLRNCNQRCSSGKLGKISLGLILLEAIILPWRENKVISDASESSLRFSISSAARFSGMFPVFRQIAVFALMPAHSLV